MTYEKMARAMRYYYNTNILEKVPQKRLHFRFSAKISSNLLHESNSKPLLNTNDYRDMYTLTKEKTSNIEPVMVQSNDIVNEYPSGHILNNQSRDTFSENDVHSPHKTIKQETECSKFSCNETPKITTTTVVTSPRSIPCTSTPDMWSDTDSVDDLIIDTDSE